MTATIPNNIQDAFLNQLRREREPVQITTMGGFKIKCRIKAFDRYSVLAESGDYEQIIFKHAIASISVRKNFSNKLTIQPAQAKAAPKPETVKAPKVEKKQEAEKKPEAEAKPEEEPKPEEKPSDE